MTEESPLAADNKISSLIDNAPIAPIQIILIALCYLLNMLDGFDVLAMSFAAPPISDEWQLPAHELGVVFSAALAGMMIGAMFLSPYADVFGRRPVVITSLLIVGTAMTVTGTVTAVWQLVVLRFVTGLGIGAVLASITSTVSEYSPDRSRNTIIGFIQGGYPIGAVIGGVIAAQVIPEFGWRSIFIGGGLLTLMAVILCWFFLPESAQFLVNKKPENALNRVNTILLRLRLPTLKELPETDNPDNSNSSKPGLKTLFATEFCSSTLLLWAAFCLAFCTLYFLLSWVPKLMVDSGLPFDKSVYAASAINLGGALGGAAVGKASQYIGLSRSIFAFLVLGAVGMVVFAFQVMGIPLLLSLTFFIGFFVIGGFIGLYAVAARVYPTGVRTTGIGWAIGIARLGAVIGPFLGGVMISGGYATSTIFCGFRNTTGFVGAVCDKDEWLSGYLNRQFKFDFRIILMQFAFFI